MTDPQIPLSQAIGARLRAARQTAGWTLSQLAERTNTLSKSRISNYEQGLRRLGIEAARELAAALGTVSAGSLLGLDDASNLGAEELDLIKSYRATDARGRALLRTIAGLLPVVDDVPKERGV
ncbi:helix-turn-helix transcriptional regulator [uncultured Thiodictyon sp.]|jgi:transcriptional regulator with XRE-family HTH domain|uniref:helix-turn-helix domain-containing protein n=1 Tax=uncultured Thiodictyon sp. TaxID=1846217 RepID=UPI0025DA33EE|nr:helix-turn-helix transcriptional regulator [uncultured Thiodictyon sp.]